MTAAEVIAKIAPTNPGKRFATNANANIIGVWTGDHFAPVAGLLLTGQWAHMQPVLVNGQPVVPADQWKEIH